ncbi:MAG: histidine kinase [Bacteroidales bacterium]|nr:histidine kinase [Bacteroidales bacterium]
MKKSFIDNPIFRIFVPPLYGTMVYILILLIFDSISQLTDNFFSFEVFLCIAITYILSELMRFIISLINKFYPKTGNFTVQIIIQLITNGICAIFITTVIIAAYFTYLVGFSKFITELIVFNTIFLFTSVFYNMIYFSILYLNKINEIKLIQENLHKDHLTSELRNYKNKINPFLLYNSLETLISLAHKDSVKADNFINCLSNVYRNILFHKRNELINLENELGLTDDFLYILNYNHNSNIKWEFDIQKKYFKYKIIPGTLSIIIEYIVNRSIISDIQALKIKCYTEGNNLIIKNKINDRLIPEKQNIPETQNLERAYSYFSDNPFEIKEENQYQITVIPLLTVN